MPQIHVKSSDGKCFAVDSEILKYSPTIRDMFDYAKTNELNCDAVSLPMIDEVGLKKILEWMIHHKDDPPKTGNSCNLDIPQLGEWDAKFFDMDSDMLFAILYASYYLQIQSLVDASCNHIANQIKANGVVKLMSQGFRTEMPEQKEDHSQAVQRCYECSDFNHKKITDKESTIQK